MSSSQYPQQQQQPPPPQQQQGGRNPNQQGRGGGGRMPYNTNTYRPAWQPTAPGGGAAAYGGRGGAAPPYYGYNPYGPYGQQQQPPPPWAYNQQQQQQQQQQRMMMQQPQGGVYYPPPPNIVSPNSVAATSPNASTTTPVVVPAPRAKKPLTITDKQGNVIDLSAAAAKKPVTTPTAAAATTTSPAASVAATTPTGSESSAAPPTAPQLSAGSKLREAALQRLEAEQAAVKMQEEAKRKEAELLKKEEEELAARKEAEAEAARERAEELARKQQQDAEEAARKQAQEELSRKQQAEEAEAARKASEEKSAMSPRKSLSDLLQSTSLDSPTKRGSVTKRRVYAKNELFRLMKEELIQERPASLPDMSIVKGATRGKSGGRRDSGSGGGGGGGGGGEWNRGSTQNRRQGSIGDQGGAGGGGGGGGQWSRGQAPPKAQKGGRQKSGRGSEPQFFDGPVAPLVKSANHWKPRKSTSALDIAEKKAKSILNKMTKEKFDKLSEQMAEIPIISSEILTMMIDTVYDKAIDEPSFGDMYADLCVKLAQSAQTSKFVHIIESDEEPPTEGGAPSGGESSSHTVYRWSNDVGTSDAEIVGPFASIEACYDVALSEEEETPVERGDMELELVEVCIRRGMFVKIMKKKGAMDDEEGVFYTVYFPVSEAQECGQQLSEIFLSEVECQSDANKKNSFKRSLLNKCEEEFNKQDIYVDWKKEKKAYEDGKSSMTESERAEKEEELEFRRIRIKKQMLGNVKFIGQLYKKGLLKEKIMRYCIASLLELEALEDSDAKNPEYKDTGRIDIDEEDHEAICSIFTTIGSTIDKPAAANFMRVCFDKILRLSTEKLLPSRSRFMYKDLLELRENNWIPRRKVEKAKTLDEIRKDVEQEERRQAQQAMRSTNRPDYQQKAGRQDSRGNRPTPPSANRSRPIKPVTETDEDGFTTIGSKSNFSQKNPPKVIQPRGVPIATKQAYAALDDEQQAPITSTSEPLDKAQLDLHIKKMRTDFIADGGSVDELLQSMDEMSGTPDAGTTLVARSAEAAMECKDAERGAIVRILSILYEKGRLRSEEIEEGLSEVIDEIDNLVLDAPRAYEYLGQILAEMLRINAIGISYVCGQLEKSKLDGKTQVPEKLMMATLAELKKVLGQDGVSSVVNGSEESLKALLGSGKWESISKAA